MHKLLNNSVPSDLHNTFALLPSDSSRNTRNTNTNLIMLETKIIITFTIPHINT